jgi:hypothetical protein
MQYFALDHFTKSWPESKIRKILQYIDPFFTSLTWLKSKSLEQELLEKKNQQKKSNNGDKRWYFHFTIQLKKINLIL